MIKIHPLVFILLLGFQACSQQKEKNKMSDILNQAASLHSFKVEALDGGTIDFGSFKGKKILIINTASECGYTPQYRKLQQLHEQYGSKIAVIGFPCNDFGGQEPGYSAEIKSFCSREFKVTFPMAAKVQIKGDDPSPIYAWLTDKKLNGVMDEKVSWNFNKFLIDEDGRLLKKFGSGVSPMSREILDLIN
jgi:glutathione peroxidase